jgi:hypothetical protein
MVRLHHGGARPVAALHVVGEAVLDARIDVELADRTGEQLQLERGEEWPHQPLPAICGVEEHVQ